MARCRGRAPYRGSYPHSARKSTTAGSTSSARRRRRMPSRDRTLSSSRRAIARIVSRSSGGERHDSIDPVEELRPHELPHPADEVPLGLLQPVVGRLESRAGPAERVHPQIRRHQDDGVGEARHPAGAVGQAAPRRGPAAADRRTTHGPSRTRRAGRPRTDARGSSPSADPRRPAFRRSGDRPPAGVDVLAHVDADSSGPGSDT